MADNTGLQVSLPLPGPMTLPWCVLTSVNLPSPLTLTAVLMMCRPAAVWIRPLGEKSLK